MNKTILELADFLVTCIEADEAPAAKADSKDKAAFSRGSSK